MEKLSEAELAILRFWRYYIRTKYDKSVRPTLVYYLMAEMLVEYTGKLPEKERPHRPVEAALNSIGCYEGTFSKWRKKWIKVWLEYNDSHCGKMFLILRAFFNILCRIEIRGYCGISCPIGG